MLDARVRAELASGQFAFIDAGCGSGGSIDHCQRRFGLGRGLGLECSGADLSVAQDRGLAAAQCDLISEDLPVACVDFVSMMDFLEHLPDLETATRVIAKCARAARQFLFIRHPSFESIEYLAQFGLKLPWTDWAGHTNMMRLEDFRAVVDRAGWPEYVVIPDMPILDSSHPAVVPLSAPPDTREYDAAMHGTKPFVRFDRVVYGKYDIFVKLNPELPSVVWQRIASCEGWRSEWTSHAAMMPGERGAMQSTLDSIARTYASPGEPARNEIDALVQRGVRESPRLAVQLVHLLNAFGQTSGVGRVLAIGADAAFPAAYLAARFPGVHVDIGAPTEGEYDFAFGIDPPGADLDARRAEVASCVRSGGWWYVPAHEPALTELLEDLVRGLEPGLVDEVAADVLAIARLDLDPARRARLAALCAADILVRP